MAEAAQTIRTTGVEPKSSKLSCDPHSHEVGRDGGEWLKDYSMAISSV